MMVDTIRTVSDRVSYCDDEPTLNIVVVRQLVAENNVSVVLTTDWHTELDAPSLASHRIMKGNIV